MNTNEDLRALHTNVLGDLRERLISRGSAVWTVDRTAALDYAIAALARQEEGREAVAFAQFEDGRAVAVSFIRSETTGCTTPLYTHPTPPSAGEGDADCETCGGVGTIDETLGGHAFSNPDAKCPDCNGLGEVSHPTPQSGEVYVDFPRSIGTAGPFPVVDGRVSMPDATVADLVARLSAPASPQGVSEAIELLRHRLCNDEDAWRALLVVMNALNYGTAAGAAPEGWQAKAHELLDRLAKASPPNVLHQQLTILGDMAALLRCMYPQQPGAQHGQEGRDG